MSRINIFDKIGTNEHKGGFRGEVIFGKGRHMIPYTDPFGNKSYHTKFEEITYRDENIVPIGGYQFAFSKLFNIGFDQESTLRVGHLNDEAPQMKIGVPRDQYKSIHYDAETSITESGILVNSGVNISAMNYIFGFMIGDGGCREDNSTPIAPNYKNRNLYHAIPFRMSNDGYPMPEGKYFGKATTYQGTSGMESVISSYLKLFDDPKPRIVHAWKSENPSELNIVDDTVFASTSSVRIESYVEINLSVSQYDVRGYATSNNVNPRVNEFALVAGWFNNELNDYESLTMFTHFTRPSIMLSDGDSIEAIYRLYAR